MRSTVPNFLRMGILGFMLIFIPLAVMERDTWFEWYSIYWPRLMSIVGVAVMYSVMVVIAFFVSCGVHNNLFTVAVYCVLWFLPTQVLGYRGRWTMAGILGNLVFVAILVTNHRILMNKRPPQP